MGLKLTILGSNAAMPAHGRFTSSQVIENEQSSYLIDCGEGCQIRMAQYKIKRNKIAAIFISHLHGDHLFGLPGVITSFFHFNRTHTLRIIGPVGIKKYVETVLAISESHIAYPIVFTEIHAESLTKVYQDSKINVFAFPLNHRIKTNGYLFETRVGSRNIIKEKIKQYRLTVEEIKQLKNGHNVLRPSGELLDIHEMTHPQAEPIRYAYCSDTRYTPNLISYVEGVQAMYHEATYEHSLQQKADERGHSTAVEAANVAKAAKIGRLFIGHFSSKYKYPQSLLEEARSVFPQSELAIDGAMFFID